jgi:CubicO group peptidase (beta-lactamase class C family)
MRTSCRVRPLAALLTAAVCVPIAAIAQSIPTSAAIDAEVAKLMTRTNAKGIAVAVIDRGKVGHVRAYGSRNAK